MRVTKRLVVRALEPSDYENWAQCYTMLRPPRNEWDEGPWKASALTRAEFRKILTQQRRQRATDKTYSYAFFRQDDGVLVGLAYVMDVSRHHFQNGYLGYRVFNPYWGEGYASEGCRAVVDIAFKDLKLHRLEAGITPTNKSSVRVAKSLGFRKEGLSLRRLLVNGKWRDLLLYAATSEDFRIKFKTR